MAIPSGPNPRAAGDDPDVPDADEEDEEEVEFDDDFDDDDEEEEDYADSDDPFASRSPSAVAELRRLAAAPVPVRVYGVTVRGNVKTRAAVVHAEVDDLFGNVSSFSTLVGAAAAANARLRRLGVFDKVGIILDAGPEEIPGSAAVVVEVEEAGGVVCGGVGGFASIEADSLFLEGSLKFKNLFGYADIWDASAVKWLDQAGEISAGVYVPRLKAIPIPLMAQTSLISEDWLKLVSSNEHVIGLTFGLLSTMHHDLVYNLSWRTLNDPSRMSSLTNLELGERLLSSIKYTYKIDSRDSYARPTRGYAFHCSSCVGGLAPNIKISRCLKQEIDLRGSLPLGIVNAAISFGVSAGIILPLGGRSTDSCPEQFHLSSPPLFSFGRPSSLFGFKARRLVGSQAAQSSSDNSASSEQAMTIQKDAAGGGDLAAAAFADLSFDLPLKPLRDLGIYGHTFISAANVTKLADAGHKNFSLHGFLQKFGCSAGFGLILPTKLFRMEINYCYMLNRFTHDVGKTGVQFNFSTP